MRSLTTIYFCYLRRQEIREPKQITPNYKDLTIQGNLSEVIIQYLCKKKKVKFEIIRFHFTEFFPFFKF